MLRRREKEIGIDVVILGKRPPLRVFQIDAPHVTVFREIQHLYGCDPFLLNQNLQSFHLGFCKNPSASSFLCYYSLHNLLLLLWCKIILLTDATELSNSNYL